MMVRSGRSPGAALVAGVLLALAVGAACAGSPEGPRSVAVGLDACAGCHMLVDDTTRAAQWVEEGGRILVFDEPGCLVAWLEDHPGAVGRAWVADAVHGAWTPAEDAAFLRDAVATSMGYEVVAYADAEAARARAAEHGGRVQGWRELLDEGVRPGGGRAHAH